MIMNYLIYLLIIIEGTFTNKQYNNMFNIPVEL